MISRNFVSQQKKDVIALAFCIFLFFILCSVAYAAKVPELPRTYIDTTFSLPTGGTTHTVNAGGNFQTALNNAQLGDVIILQAGATFTGNFTLPNKTTGSGWIYIISSAYESLPQPGTRVSPSDVSNMPTISLPYGNDGRGIITEKGAHHYRFVGIHIRPTDAVRSMWYLMFLGGETANYSNNIIIDRCFLAGHMKTGKGVKLDVAYGAVIDSHFDNFYGGDSNTIWATQTPGPLKIVNNFLGSSSINIFFGGSNHASDDLTPSDIEIRWNHFYKSLDWKGVYAVKNHIESKHSRRVLVEGNIFENMWASAQYHSVMLKSENQGPGYGSPFSQTAHWTIRFNKFINVDNWVNLSRAYTQSTAMEYLHFHDNLILFNPNGGWHQNGFQISPPDHLIIENNTMFPPRRDIMFVGSTTKGSHLTVRNNLFCGTSISHADGGGFGESALNTSYPGSYVFTHNVLVAPNAGTYPSGNYLPNNIGIVKFINYTGNQFGNYRLANDSPYKNAGTDGRDIGADIDAILGAIAGTCTGMDCLPPPSPAVSTPTGLTIIVK